MARLVRKPKLNVEYTFRRIDKKTGKTRFDTYRYTGEITEKNRFVFYHINLGYFMDCTLEHFSYMMRKQLVRQKDANGKISRRAQELTPLEKMLIDKQGLTPEEANRTIEVKKDKADRFISQALSELEQLTSAEKIKIEENTGVKIESLSKLFSTFRQLPEGKMKDNSWNSLMKKYIKVASMPGIEINFNLIGV